jgi:hypothetical protein
MTSCKFDKKKKKIAFFFLLYSHPMQIEGMGAS